jgi:hypothetical protein
MKNWPDHYPNRCPPKEAYTHHGILYRFINRNEPQSRDFESYYDKDPKKDWGEDACLARGLSVVKCSLGVKDMRNAIPALRKKKISRANITSNCGILANTPSSSSGRHCTWWVSKSISNPQELFEAVNMSEIEDV